MVQRRPSDELRERARRELEEDARERYRELARQMAQYRRASGDTYRELERAGLR